jgi:hypothetical protein
VAIVVAPTYVMAQSTTDKMEQKAKGAALLIGLIAGPLAGRVVSGHGYGVLGDIVVGPSAPSWEVGSSPLF